jgi:phosphoglycolate phosphatase-like HAD superfamily hydrolase
MARNLFVLMPLIIFDIDGTLTQSVQADDICFVRALAEVWGFENVDTDWSRYQHVTDAGLLHELHETRTGRTPTTGELHAFRAHFLALLAEMLAENPVAPIPGAPELLNHLPLHTPYRVSLATGAWGSSARMKMRSAGMRFEDHPAASSDDAPDRVTIMQLSRQRATERFGEPEHVVYVGDGIWDARACRNLGLPFIGIGSGERATRLQAEGAVDVLPDFSDLNAFLKILQQATKR